MTLADEGNPATCAPMARPRRSRRFRRGDVTAGSDSKLTFLLVGCLRVSRAKLVYDGVEITGRELRERSLRPPQNVRRWT